VRWPLLAVAALTACRVSLSPLQNKVAVGQEPYLALQARGESGSDDIFIVRPDDGTAIPVTFTRWHESDPALSSDGAMLAFVRRVEPGAPELRLVVMNLLNGAERVLWGPAEVAFSGLAWLPDGTLALGMTGDSLLIVAAPPHRPAATWLAARDAPGADSSLWVLLGEPPFARVARCHPELEQPCVFPRTGPPQPLEGGARLPMRWGGDSLAYLVDGAIKVRPLGPGRSRRFATTPELSGVVRADYFPGP